MTSHVSGSDTTSTPAETGVLLKLIAARLKVLGLEVVPSLLQKEQDVTG